MITGDFLKHYVFRIIVVKIVVAFWSILWEIKMQRLENVNVATAHSQGQDYGDGIDVMHVYFVLRVLRCRRIYDV